MIPLHKKTNKPPMGQTIGVGSFAILWERRQKIDTLF
jgi:hypothetical protein